MLYSTFTFLLLFTDRVFTAEETTNQLYQDIAKPLVVSTVEGYNGTECILIAFLVVLCCSSKCNCIFMFCI